MKQKEDTVIYVQIQVAISTNASDYNISTLASQML